MRRVRHKADAAAREIEKTGKSNLFKNCFFNCITRITNTKIDNGKYLDAVLPRYNFLEYSNDHSKTCMISRKRRRVEINTIVTVQNNTSSKLGMLEWLMQMILKQLKSLRP